MNIAKSLDGDHDVDILDLAQFCEDWLWIAPWSELHEMLAIQSGSSSMTMAIQSAAEPVVLVDVPATSSDAVVIEPLTVEQLVDWIDQVWQSGEFGGSEEEYLSFRNAILESDE